MEHPDIISKLDQLVAKYRFWHTGVASSLRCLAVDLSNCINRDDPWSWQYIHQVIRRKLPISNQLTRAVLVLYAYKCNDSASELETVRAVAPVGLISGTVLIVTASKKCSRCDCNQAFVPVHPSQKYCTTRCREISRRRRRGHG